MASSYLDSTGYGPSHRLMFDGDGEKYELWETKFLGHMRLKKLHDVVVQPAAERAQNAPSAEKKAEAFAHLIQYLDDRSLSLVMRDCKDDGRAALATLREHYRGSRKPRIMALYNELCSMQLKEGENVTDYVIRGENAAASLKSADEIVSDSLLVAMLLKGLPSEYRTFATVITQRETETNFTEFKVALRSFEENERIQCRDSRDNDSVMKAGSHQQGNGVNVTCYKCNKQGHKSFQCLEKTSQMGNQTVRCFNCGKEGHKSPGCPDKQKKPRFNGRGRGRGRDTAKMTSIDDCGGGHSFVMRVTDDDVVHDSARSLLVDCGATAHIITDKEKFSSFEKNFDPSKHFIELADGNRSNNIVLGKGKATTVLYDVNGISHNVILENALYIPSFSQDIFSVQSAVEKGASLNLSANVSELRTPDGTRFNCEKKGKLYYLNKMAQEKCVSRSLNEWHQVLGHCNERDIMSLEKVVSGMKIVNARREAEVCETCTLGKMPQTVSRIPDKKATKPLEFVHTDLAGPVTPTAREGFRYAMSFVDDFSGSYFVYFLKNKSDAVKALERYLADTAPFGKVKRMRCDNAGEYMSDEFKQKLLDNQIRHEMSAPYSPHQNGTAERSWRTLFDMGRCLLIESGVSKKLWTYAVMASAYIRNRCFNPRIGMTPYEAMTGNVPDLSGMHVFGSVCYAYVQLKKKLDARSEKGIFVGYDRASPAYLVYISKTGEIRRVRCVRFTDRFDVVRQSEDEFVPSDVPEGEVSSEDELVEGPTDEELVDNGQRRYPDRNRNRPGYLDDYVANTNYDDCSVDYCYRLVPKTYADAVSSSESTCWQEAMEEEYRSLVDNETFELVGVPKDKPVVGGRWVFAIKTDSKGNEKHKARYVAKGYSQTPNVDYGETFAPTARITSVRMLLQLAVQQGMVVHQMDVKTAYLNAPIDCELYMEQPEGYVELGRNGKKLVWRLKKSLYGLKQSGRNWSVVLQQFLISEGFNQSLSDPCVYTKEVKEAKIILIVWVDDILVAASNENVLDSVKNSLKARFKMKDMGRLVWFLGIEVVQSERYIEMSQKRYIEKMLKKFGMEECKPKAMPCEMASSKLTETDSKPLEDAYIYRELVGSLIYLMTCTRPDICFVVTRLSQSLSKPTKANWEMAKHVLRYLKGTMDQGLRFAKCDRLELEGFCDSDWGSDHTDRRSISGFAFQLSSEGPLISWKSKKQQCVALSTCEAEYIALSVAVQEAKFLRQLIHDMFYSQEQVIIHGDNQGAIALAKNPVHHQRSKHIDIRYHYVRSEVQSGTIGLEYVPTEYNIADVFTKPVSRARLNSFVNLKGRGKV